MIDEKTKPHFEDIAKENPEIRESLERCMVYLEQPGGKRLPTFTEEFEKGSWKLD